MQATLSSRNKDETATNAVVTIASVAVLLNGKTAKPRLAPVNCLMISPPLSILIGGFQLGRKLGNQLGATST